MLRRINGTNEFYFQVDEKNEKCEHDNTEQVLKLLDSLPYLSQGNASALLKSLSMNIGCLKVALDDLKGKDKSKYLILKSYVQQLETRNTHISDLFDKEIMPWGIIPGELITITAPSGGGKTALCIMLAVCLLSGHNPYHSEKIYEPKDVIYVSLEQTEDQIIYRLLSTISAFNNLNSAFGFSSAMTGQVENKTAFEVACKLFAIHQNKLKILSLNNFDGTPSVEEICELITSSSENLKNPIVIIDQYENIEGAGNPMDDTVARTLKIYAEKNQTPIFLQCQLNKNSAESSLNKDGSEDPNKITALSLKGTSGLLHQSSAVMVITKDGKESAIQGHKAMRITITLKKSRYSSLTCIKMNWFPSLNVFTDYVETRGRKANKGEND